MKIGLFIPSFQKYDAMGNDVFEMYKILCEMNDDVIIFANDFDTSIIANIQYVKQADEFLKDQNNILIYHHGVYVDFFDKLANAQCRKIFRYHNITYPSLFEGYDDNAVSMCDKGRKQMFGTVKKFDFFLSCSEFNNIELIEDFDIDAKRTSVLAPFHNVENWNKIEEDDNLKKILSINNTINILNVGRLSPNKNHQLLIKSFADYNKYYNNNSILHIVGKKGPETYYNEIIDCIKIYDLENSVKLYIDGISESKLKTLYKYSDLFVMTSLHEGFCVPIVESMYFKLPIISSSSTALQYTVNSNGIVLDDLKPINFSVAIKIVIEHKISMKNISEKGYNRFTYRTNKLNFINFMENIFEA
jgi:glycosyltransferase involved in cell wall biosynthesis